MARNGDMNGNNPHSDVYEIKEGEWEYCDDVIQKYYDTLLSSDPQIGYPLNLDFDYGSMDKLLRFHLNNAGDPFSNGHLRVDTAKFEIGVLDWFAKLWGLGRNEYWGYVTTGGTEGNMHGIFIGRELHPEGILYASSNCHYSIMKIARLLRIELEKVNVLHSGAIDCQHLKKMLEKNKGKHAILNVTMGTTFKGAIDDLDEVVFTLRDAGYAEQEFYIHCDAALCGVMLPLLENAPELSFSKYPIGSISVSGHKFIGCPIPCGVQMTRKETINEIQSNSNSNVEILKTKDYTISGSRSGHTPVFMWHALTKKGIEGLAEEAKRCIDNARYLKKRLESEGVCATLNHNSCAVVFERPPDDKFVIKWQLSCQDELAQVVVMQHVTRQRIDSFLKDLSRLRRSTSPPHEL